MSHDHRDTYGFVFDVLLHFSIMYLGYLGYIKKLSFKNNERHCSNMEILMMQLWPEREKRNAPLE